MSSFQMLQSHAPLNLLSEHQSESILNPTSDGPPSEASQMNVLDVSFDFDLIAACLLDENQYSSGALLSPPSTSSLLSPPGIQARATGTVPTISENTVPPMNALANGLEDATVYPTNKAQNTSMSVPAGGPWFTSDLVTTCGNQNGGTSSALESVNWNALPSHRPWCHAHRQNASHTTGVHHSRTSDSGMQRTGQASTSTGQFWPMATHSVPKALPGYRIDCDQFSGCNGVDGDGEEEEEGSTDNQEVVCASSQAAALRGNSAQVTSCVTDYRRMDPKLLALQKEPISTHY
ncbi:unnamed protein product, partial [Dicrocoelium dendriticum]